VIAVSVAGAISGAFPEAVAAGSPEVVVALADEDRAAEEELSVELVKDLFGVGGRLNVHNRETLRLVVQPTGNLNSKDIHVLPKFLFKLRLSRSVGEVADNDAPTRVAEVSHDTASDFRSHVLSDWRQTDSDLSSCVSIQSLMHIRESIKTV
jgi:hypothetical protein